MTAPAQPEQPLRARVLEALHTVLHDNVLHAAQWPTSTGLVAIEQTDAVLAAVQPDLDALRGRLDRALDRNRRLREELARLAALHAQAHAAAHHQGEPRDRHCRCTREGCPGAEELPWLDYESGNAEDCPQCRNRHDLPYPFLCPGHPTTTQEP